MYRILSNRVSARPDRPRARDGLRRSTRSSKGTVHSGADIRLARPAEVLEDRLPIIWLADAAVVGIRHPASGRFHANFPIFSTRKTRVQVM